MENRNGYHNQNSALWRSLRDGDFEEADVWAVLKERKDSNYSKVGQCFGLESPFQIQRSLNNLPSAARMIPSNSTEGGSKGVTQQQSAPVKIPDWSKISNKKSKKIAHNNYHHDDSDSDADDHDRRALDDDEEDDDDDDDDVYDCKAPPHEFIAERLAKSQISSFSVFEGVGRTLKGRDLSKVRNAVLTRTGFIE